MTRMKDKSDLLDKVVQKMYENHVPNQYKQNAEQKWLSREMTIAIVNNAFNEIIDTMTVLKKENEFLKSQNKKEL